MPVGTTKWTIWNYSFVGAALIGVLISVGSILYNHGVFLLEETPKSVTLPRPYFTPTQAEIQGVSQDDPCPQSGCSKQ